MRQHRGRVQRAQLARTEKLRPMICWLSEQACLLHQHWLEGTAVELLRDPSQEHSNLQVARVHRQAWALSLLCAKVAKQQEEFLVTGGTVSQRQIELAEEVCAEPSVPFEGRACACSWPLFTCMFCFR